MRAKAAGRKLRLSVTLEDWPLKQPFRITGHLFTATQVIVAELSDGTHDGRGEAAGVYYLGDTPQRAREMIESIRQDIEAGIDREDLARMLPPGAARNALDCALWDLEWRRTGKPVWELAGLPPPRPLLSSFTIGGGTPDEMAEVARAYAEARFLKLKLLGDGQDEARLHTVRAARPEVRLAVDANQGFGRDSLRALWPALAESHVELVEQPYPIGQDSLLDGEVRRIPVAADESLQSLAELDGLCGRFDTVNIKLDKCGGLTEGLAIARRARTLGLGVMVGNMMGTSLSMAPSFVLGQLCDVVDLDGPVFLARDRSPGVAYRGGEISMPDPFWGGVQT